MSHSSWEQTTTGRIARENEEKETSMREEERVFLKSFFSSKKKFGALGNDAIMVSLRFGR